MSQIKYYSKVVVISTDSALNIALLALFSEMLYRFPNMAVANLSRESVRAALIRGITAEQVSIVTSRTSKDQHRNLRRKFTSG